MRDVYAQRIVRLEEFVLAILKANPEMRISLPDDDTNTAIKEMYDDVERYGDTGQI